MDRAALLDLCPPITAENRPFWEGTLVGELRLQRCSHCAAVRYPEGPVCPRCLGAKARWAPACGRATLWSWTVIHQGYLAAFSDTLPYLVALVRLEEEVLLYSWLVDPPPDLRCDLPLVLDFHQLSAERALPVFRVVTL